MYDALKTLDPAVLDPDNLTLTVNRRLSRTLTRMADQHHWASGATVWPTPRILPLSAWLEQCWAQRLDQREAGASTGRSRPPTLLTPWQERLLWERIIATSPEGEPLLRMAEAAKNAQAAWNLLKEWRVTPTEADLYDHEDAQVFYAWSVRFATLCRKRGWLDRASLPQSLISHLSDLDLPQRIFLAGFRQQGGQETPGLTAFLNALAQANVAIEHLDLSSPPGTALRRGCPSTMDELHAAAQWARDRLTHHPEGKIGIVVPAMERLLPQVVDTFTRVFYPGCNPTTLDPRTKLFNLSLGARLTETRWSGMPCCCWGWASGCSPWSRPPPCSTPPSGRGARTNGPPAVCWMAACGRRGFSRSRRPNSGGRRHGGTGKLPPARYWPPPWPRSSPC